MFGKNIKRLKESNTVFISLLIVSVITFTFYSFSIIDQTLPLQYSTALRRLVTLNQSFVESSTEMTSVETVTDSVVNDSENSVINILKWTDPMMPPFNYLKNGRRSFVDNECKYDNCFITDDKAYLKSITDFDVIIFNGKNLIALKPEQLPQQRSQKQKYIFANMESSHYYPVCCERFDSYFNWTYTYRIDSDIRWGYITVYDLDDNIIGPKIDMTWPEHMDPVTNEVIETLETKSKAAAWFVSNCNYVRSGRNQFVRQLQKELQKYKLFVDIYGKCGPLECPRSTPQVCFEKVKKDYYFYLAFENSYAEDYVTEKLMTALNNYAVPIVYGTANYSRFLPPGSYVNAYELGVQKLAATINTIINNRTMYHDFFRWRNHFKYKDTLDNDDVCKLCEVLNDRKLMNSVTIVKNLRTWWNGERADANCREFFRNKSRKCKK